MEWPEPLWVGWGRGLCKVEGRHKVREQICTRRVVSPGHLGTLSLKAQSSGALVLTGQVLLGSASSSGLAGRAAPPPPPS